MSPAGIPMFYGCDDENTALRETASEPGHFAIGEFEIMRRAVLLDLTDIPEVPSLFEPVPDFVEVPPRRDLRYLHQVAGEVSRRIERGDRSHVEYIPTQVVTEFIRTRVTWEGSRIDGIRYSRPMHGGHVSYVRFADQSNMLGTSARSEVEDRWLKLVHVSRRRFDPAEGEE